MLRHRSGPLFSLQREPSRRNGLGVDESRCRAPYICLRTWSGVDGLITRRRHYVAPTVHAWSLGSEQIFVADVWPIRNNTEIRCLILHLWISTFTFPAPPAVLVSCSQAVSFEFIGRRWPPTHVKAETWGLLNNIKSGPNDYCGGGGWIKPWMER